jgi:hypothetical protein
MSATKKADNQFLNETKLLVKNDRTPKRNNKLNDLNSNIKITDDPITLANKKENSLWLLNDRVGQRAENPTGDFITKSNYDPERDELLKEYQSQHPSSFEYTDDQGNKRYRKFLLPEFDVDFDETVIPPSSNPTYIAKEIDKVLKKINRRETELAEIRRRETELKDSPQPTFIHKAGVRILLYNIENEKAYILKEIADEQLRFDALQRRQDLVNQEKKDVDRQNAIIRENNKSKITEYADTLKILNKGQMNTNQSPNETDEEYLNRLRRNAEIEVPNEQVQDMKFLINQNFRKNMKMLLKNDVLIEQVMNSLNNIDKNNINKRIPLFRTEFEKIFGLNNKLLETQDILNFVTKFLRKHLPGDNPVLPTEPEKQSTEQENQFQNLEDIYKEPKIKYEKKNPLSNTEIKEEKYSNKEKYSPYYSPYFKEKIKLKNRNPVAEVEEYKKPQPEDIIPAEYVIPPEDIIPAEYVIPPEDVIPKPISRYPNLEPIDDEPPELEPSYDYAKQPYVFEYKEKRYYIFVAEKHNNSRNTYKILLSETGEIGSFIEIKPKELRKEQMNLYEHLSTILDAHTPTDVAKELINLQPNCRIDFNETKNNGANKPVGYGIASDIRNSRYAQLGRYKVNLQSLYHKNFFKLYSANGDKVGKRGNNVSDLFVRLILQLVEGKRPSQQDIDLLTSNELHLFNWAIQVCGLKSKHSPVSLKYTVNELKSRLNILEGEIKSGNDNPDILKEIVNILHHLKDFNIISPKKIKQYLSQFEIY